MEYKTVEHFFQAAKAQSVEAAVNIANTKTPGDAKRAGRGATLRTDWDHVRLDIMRFALRMKFSDPKLRDKLVATDYMYLAEGNTWNDTFWGVDLETGKGENNLGMLLMELRDTLRDGMTL